MVALITNPPTKNNYLHDMRPFLKYSHILYIYIVALEVSQFNSLVHSPNKDTRKEKVRSRRRVMAELVT